MKIETKLLGMFTAIALVACGTPDTKPDPEPEPDPDPTPTGFQQPAGTVPLNFTIDASGRPGFYADAELEWKGNFNYDPETRIAQNTGGAWDGPFAPVYDDGPWTAGGHEPIGSVAGDDKFGITMFFASPTEAVPFSYGAQIAPGAKCASSGGCWIWPAGDNGTFTVQPGQTTAITAAPLTLAPEGQFDIKISLDTAALHSDFTFGTEPVKLKGSYCGWNPETVTEKSGTVFTYTLSASPNCLMIDPSRVEFVWVWTGTDGAEVEYKKTEGVTAASKGPADADYVSRDVALTGTGDNNPSFTIPE